MKWNKYGQQVEDNDPTGIYDEEPQNPEPLPTTPAPAATPVVDPAVLAAYQQQLAQEANERARLQRENEELRNQRQAPAALTPEQEREFFDKPMSNTRQMIQEEVGRAVEPINRFTQQFARQQTFNTLKQQMRDSGNFPYLTKIEQVFDAAMNGIDPTVQSMTQAYQLALGAFISQGGRLDDTDNGNGTPAPSSAPAAPVNRNRPLPPHAPPSTRPINQPKNGTQKVRALTEQEKIIKRHNGWSHDAQYLYWTEHVDPKSAGHVTPEMEKKQIKEIYGVDI